MKMALHDIDDGRMYIDIFSFPAGQIWIWADIYILTHKNKTPYNNLGTECEEENEENLAIEVMYLRPVSLL